MRQRILIVAVFLAGAVSALIFVIRHPSSLSSSRAEPTVEAREREPIKRANATPPTPIQPAKSFVESVTGVPGLPRNTAAGMPNPKTRGKGSVEQNYPGESPGEAAKAMYTAFIHRADLNKIQQERFDQIIQDIWRMEIERGRQLAEHRKPSDLEGDQMIEEESYTRVKAILTPQQYEVFSDEIGWQFPFVIAYALPHPNW
jgi:hypothetical protein